MVAAVIFDMDGTLIDSVTLHAQAWHDALKKFGVDVPLATLQRQIGKGGDKIFPTVAPKLDEAQRDEIDAFRSAHFKEKYLDQVRGFSGVRELFEQLRSLNVRIALGSSAKGDELEAYRKLAGIEDFDVVSATSDDAENSKPDPDIFQAVVQKLKLPAASCVVVGDSPYDMQSAQRAGIAGLAVLTGGFGADELRQAGAKRIYEQVSDILDAVRASGVKALE